MSWQLSEEHAAISAATGAGGSKTQATEQSSPISPIILAASLALAVAAGAFFSISGTAGFDAMWTNASIDDLLGVVGLSRTGVAEVQPRQGDKLTKLDRDVATIAAQVAVLTSRMETAARMDADLDRLKAQMAAIETSQEDAYSIGGGEFGIALLRTSIDDISERTDKQIATVNKRLDRLESLVDGRGEVTGSITRGPARKRSHRANLTDWSAQEILGDVILTGRTGSFEARPGTIVPGLGRVEAVRHEDGRSIVITNRGQIVTR